MRKEFMTFLIIAILFLVGCSNIENNHNIKSEVIDTKSSNNINRKTNDNLIKELEENKELIGGDKDEHGCIGAAGYTWCQAKEKCIRVWEENCTEEIKNTETNDNLDELMKKYQYECSNMGDHTTFDYDMQDKLRNECQKKCCDGKYCDTCQWSGYGECFNNCEANAPDGMCVNCDGVCWETGHLAFFNNMIATC